MADEVKLTNDEWRRTCAVELFNRVWALMEKGDRTSEEDEQMVHAAHASRHHWNEVGAPKNAAIGNWQVARVYSLLGIGDRAMHYAKLALDFVSSNEVEDWLVASAHEGMARAQFAAGLKREADQTLAKAKLLAAQIADKEDRNLIESQIATAYTKNP